MNVLDLCNDLNVSSVTIRKDLKLLEDKSLLYRTHGGATSGNPYTVDKPVNEKEKIRSEEKMDIGAVAAALVEPNDCIIIASGTTVLSLARNIKPHIQEAQLNRKMIAASQKTIVLADSSKFGKRGFGRICGLEDIEQVITDSGISDHMVKTLKEMGIEVTIV